MVSWGQKSRPFLRLSTGSFRLFRLSCFQKETIETLDFEEASVTFICFLKMQRGNKFAYLLWWSSPCEWPLRLLHQWCGSASVSRNGPGSHSTGRKLQFLLFAMLMWGPQPCPRSHSGQCRAEAIRALLSALHVSGKFVLRARPHISFHDVKRSINLPWCLLSQCTLGKIRPKDCGKYAERFAF